MKIKNLIKENKKFYTFMFFQHIIENISKMHFDEEEVTSNDLIAFYAKEAIIAMFEENDEVLFDTYIDVATLLALINSMTTPFGSPSSMDEVYKIKGLTDNDIIAECVGLMARASFEKNMEEFNVYSRRLIDLVLDSLPADDTCDPDNRSDTTDETKDNISS